MKKIVLLITVLMITIIAGVQVTYAATYNPVSEFEGKSLLGFGDSIASGAGANSVGYLERIGQLFDMDYVNYANGGMTVTVISGSDNNLITQINDAIAAGEKADYILFNGTTNDALEARTVGAITTGYVAALNNATLYGAAEEAMNAMKTAWPDAIIIYVRPHNMDSRSNLQSVYGDIMVEVAKKYSIPVVSLFESEFDTHDDIIKVTYTYDTYETGTGDGTHPNSLGYDKFYVPAVVGKMIEARNIIVPFFDTQTVNGVTLEYDSTTGEFALDGTTTATTVIELVLPKVLRSGSDYYMQYFYVSGTPNFTSSTDNFLRSYDNGGSPAEKNITFSNTNYKEDLNAIQFNDFNTLHFRFDAGCSFSNFTFKLQVEKDAFTDYVNPTSSILSTETYSISTVSFNSNGGSQISSVSVSDGASIEQPLSPIKSGYIFYGWYTDAALTTKFNFDSPINNNITLYAKWVSESGASIVAPTDNGTAALFGIAWYWYAVTAVGAYALLSNKKVRKSLGIKK